MPANAGEDPADEGTKGQIDDLHRDHPKQFAALYIDKRRQQPKNHRSHCADKGDKIGAVCPVHRQTKGHANEQGQKTERQYVDPYCHDKDTSKSNLSRQSRIGEGSYYAHHSINFKLLQSSIHNFCNSFPHKRENSSLTTLDKIDFPCYHENKERALRQAVQPNLGL